MADTVTEVRRATTLPSAVTDVETTVSDGELQFQWLPITTDEQGNPITIDHYNIYRSYSPYFTPSTDTLIGTPAGGSFSDSSIGNSSANQFFYIIVAETADGRTGAPKRIGLFRFELSGGQ